MICLVCGTTLKVSNSRPQRSRNQVWRRRTCPACALTYTTEERIDLAKVASVNQQPFSRDKLFISIYNACRHRPTAAQDAAGLADTVTARLFPAIIHNQIQSSTIIAITTEVLQRFDRAAAVQYTAFHKN